MAVTYRARKAFGAPEFGPSTHLRRARPSRDLDAARRFWVEGLGLDVLWSAGAHTGNAHELLMLGWPGAAWHLEHVQDPAVLPAPTVENLLVRYVDGPLDDALVQRLRGAAVCWCPRTTRTGRVGDHGRGPGRVPTRPVPPRVVALTRAD